jgi:hypothetical protein
MFANLEGVRRVLSRRWGSAEIAPDTAVAFSLASLPNIREDVRKTCQQSAFIYEKVQSSLSSLTSIDRLTVSYLSRAIASCKSTEGILTNLSKARKQHINSEGGLADGVDVAIEILKTRIDTIYNPDWVIKNPDWESPSNDNRSEMGYSLSGAAGAGADAGGAIYGGIVGGVAGGVSTWWAGSDPAAVAAGVGGAVGVGVGSSLLYLWNWLNSPPQRGGKMPGPPIIHGPDDPNGPIWWPTPGGGGGGTDPDPDSDDGGGPVA